MPKKNKAQEKQEGGKILTVRSTTGAQSVAINGKSYQIEDGIFLLEESEYKHIQGDSRFEVVVEKDSKAEGEGE